MKLKSRRPRVSKSILGCIQSLVVLLLNCEREPKGTPMRWIALFLVLAVGMPAVAVAGPNEEPCCGGDKGK